ncbi:hypothetical protein LBMAG38_13500 [Chloroflexota bacterium]|nr:hypothetical protein LBMAG38_13500 [Chloroflexota bacterium]
MFDRHGFHGQGFAIQANPFCPLADSVDIRSTAQSQNPLAHNPLGSIWGKSLAKAPRNIGAGAAVAFDGPSPPSTIRDDSIIPGMEDDASHFDTQRPHSRKGLQRNEHRYA